MTTPGAALPAVSRNPGRSTEKSATKLAVNGNGVVAVLVTVDVGVVVTVVDGVVVDTDSVFVNVEFVT